MVTLTEEAFASLFQQYEQVRTTEAGLPLCPYCGNPLSPENLLTYNLTTEAGAGYCGVEITCDVCRRAIWEGWSRHPWIESREEALLYVAGKVLSSKLGEARSSAGPCENRRCHGRG